MLEVTQPAKDVINKYFEENETAPIRVFVASGCGGPGLAVGLDEERDHDEVVSVDELTFVVNKELLEAAKPITVDFNESGLFVSSSLKFEQPAGGGACGGCTGCG